MLRLYSLLMQSWYRLIAGVLMCFSISAMAQVVQPESQPVMERLGAWLPDSVELRGSAQGLAIHNGLAYMWRHGGQCVVLDLGRRAYLNTFYLSDSNAHCNNASFMPNKANFYRGAPSDSLRLGSQVEKHPPLLVSECFGKKCGYVTAVSIHGNTVVQRLYYDSDRFAVAQDWCVDVENEVVYAYGGRRGGRVYLIAFPMPDCSSKEVHYTDADTLHSIAIDCVGVAQGSKIYKGYAFLLDGIEKGKLWLHVVDLATGEEVQKMSLNDIGLEPEGLDVWQGWLYISFHTPNPRNNSIYRYKLCE